MPKNFPLSLKQTIAAVVFLGLMLYVGVAVPTAPMAMVTTLLLLTVYLFAFEVVGVDVAAATIMVLIGLSALVGSWFGVPGGLVPQDQIFKGFSSNAVMSIIAVMIIGAGLDKTGLMSKVAGFILRVAGKTEARIIPAISGTVAFISSFMQNVGAAALFLPVVNRVAARTGIPLSRLLMPMGFCAILGGTVTMVGSSPLILLNDLILNSNHALPADKQMATWSMFSVTPIGICLVTAGIAYFVYAGRYVLPAVEASAAEAYGVHYFKKVYGVDYVMREVHVPAQSGIIHMALDDIEGPCRIRVIAYSRGDSSAGRYVDAGGISREVGIEPGASMAIYGTQEAIRAFAEKFALEVRSELRVFAEALSPSKSGDAEVVIPPGSDLIGKSARDVWLRKTYGVALMALHRAGKTVREGEDVRSVPFQAGDTLIVYTTWEALTRLRKNRDFVVVTTEYPHEETRPHKVKWAGAFFALALLLVLFSPLKLSVSLFAGAMGMILAGVLKIEEAYRAVSWKSVFLLASLIPLGLAVETTGTAAWIAEQVLTTLGDVPIWVLQLTIAVLATFFTLVMSNVGATVLLVPLAVNIAIAAGANPAVFALTVAISTSNSFLLPTHQVNALIMGPAGYRVGDFVRAGGIMTLIFLAVSQTILNLLY
jgi:di/tricarboxylate transporter